MRTPGQSPAWRAPTSARATAAAIERLLRAGRHGQAAQCFCRRFGERWFPLEYPWTGCPDRRLLVELADGPGSSTA